MGRIQEPRPEAAGERLTGIIGEMLAELRGGAPPAVPLDSELEADLGIDSLARVELVLRVERAFDVHLPEALAMQARTPRELLRALAAASQRVALQPEMAREELTRGEEFGEPREAATLIEALEWHVARHPERVHITLLEEQEAIEPLSYGALAEEARAVAGGLEARGLEPGQAVAIMLPTGRDFFAAFVGTLCAGGVPVPLYPPFRWSQLEEHLGRQAGILANCGADVGRGEPIAFFPEGTFSRTPGLQAFRMGAFVAAASSGRPVVPVAVRGTRSLLRDGSWLPRRSPVHIVVGAPLWPRGGDWAEALRLRDAARQEILDHCGEPDAASGE